MAQFELAVIGAGIAGLNALYSAAGYLAPKAKILLVDRNAGPGGMWRNSYPFVRLHQPHGSFTVGDMAWNWKKPAEYLARGNEVVAHLAQCYSELSERLEIETRFETECADLTEDAAMVHIRLISDAKAETVTAKRVIHAAGFDIPQLSPLKLSSQNVVSTTPSAMDTASNAPAFVIGGGKTGMDACHELIMANPSRPVTLLNGKGTVFVSRDLTLPTGLPRIWRGHLVLAVFRDIAMEFDGQNYQDVFDLFRKTYTIRVGDAGEQFFYGLLSEGERDRIENGLTAIISDYFQDVVDGEGGPEILTRNGTRLPVPPDAQVINCTGHVLRQERSAEPCLSQGGRVLTITPRSAVHFLSSVSAYFLPHLFLTDTLRQSDLFEVDLDALRRIDRKLLYATATTATFYNTVALIDAVPFRVLDSCGLDLDRWFPLHRRLATLIDVKFHRKKYLSHARAALEQVACDHDIRIRPIAAG
ncbi:MAG: FAD-dependent oxidoreductase [Pseudomonadota bacterium]